MGSALGLGLGALLFLGCQSKQTPPLAAAPLAAIQWDQEYRDLQAKDDSVVQTRLKELGQKLGETDYIWLESTVEKGPIDKRFFALYALGLAQTQRSLDLLKAFAVKEQKGKEWQLARIQAVKGIFQSCKDNLERTRDGLLGVISQSSDELVRDEAHRRLKECLGK